MCCIIRALSQYFINHLHQDICDTQHLFTEFNMPFISSELSFSHLKMTLYRNMVEALFRQQLTNILAGQQTLVLCCNGYCCCTKSEVVVNVFSRKLYIYFL